VGPAHLEFLGDLNGVARAKGELFIKMRTDAAAVVNLYDPLVAAMSTSSRTRITFGSRSNTDVRLVERKSMGTSGQRLALDIRGQRINIDLPLFGEHNAVNAAAAAAAAIAVGFDADQIERGLISATWERGRLAPTKGPKGALIIDDTYNANPASMGAALKVLGELAEDKCAFAVLGDMLELGESSDEAHLAIGAMVQAARLCLLVTLGEKGKLIGMGAQKAGMAEDLCIWTESHEQAAELVSSRVRSGDVILVKGSRGMKMEKVIEALTKGIS
jgi:UDP-N-acetylmuramoyl-tripeptide--D-alanyl-D-alanine ligase